MHWRQQRRGVYRLIGRLKTQGSSGFYAPPHSAFAHCNKLFERHDHWLHYWRRR